MSAKVEAKPCPRGHAAAPWKTGDGEVYVACSVTGCPWALGPFATNKDAVKAWNSGRDAKGGPKR